MLQNKLTALAICNNIYNLLEKNVELTIHSRFNKTINLVNHNKRILSLLSEKTSIVPNGIILPIGSFEDMPIIKSTLFYSDNIVYSKQISIDLSLAESINTKLVNKYKSQNLYNFKEQLTIFLEKNPPANGFYQVLNNTSELFSGKASELIIPYTNQLATVLAEKRLDNLDDILKRLIGFGVGLTPSADDFILGILIVIDFFDLNIKAEFIKSVLKLSHRTTDISKEMLINACDGHYSQQLLMLFAILSNELDDYKPQLAVISDYGHSSGHDMLTGVCFAFDNLGS